MNTLYHVDTTGRLKPGMKIDLAPGKASVFGRNYQMKFQRAGITFELELGLPPPNPSLLSDAAYREYFLELFRLNNPRIRERGVISRLDSFFAVRSVEDAKRYLERSIFKHPPRIFNIHCAGEHPALDMTWLDQNFPRNIESFSYYYENYWSGRLISEDEHLSNHDKRGSLIELLITSQVTVGNMI